MYIHLLFTNIIYYYCVRKVRLREMKRLKIWWKLDQILNSSQSDAILPGCTSWFWDISIKLNGKMFEKVLDAYTTLVVGKNQALEWGVEEILPLQPQDSTWDCVQRTEVGASSFSCCTLSWMALWWPTAGDQGLRFLSIWSGETMGTEVASLALSL